MEPSVLLLRVAEELGIALLTAAMLLSVIRLWRGPSAVDRLLALDTLYINGVAILLLFDLRWHTPLLFEAALMIAACGFVGTVAAARYLARRTVLE